MNEQKPLDKELTEKQKVIREGWQEQLSEEQFKHISEYGWAIYPFIRIHWFPSEFINQCDIADGGLTFRPKSLQGIENNNGWFSIKEHGLPKNKDNYEFYQEETELSTPAVFIPSVTKVHPDYTHYRPIEQLKLPLY